MAKLIMLNYILLKEEEATVHMNESLSYTL